MTDTNCPRIMREGWEASLLSPYAMHVTDTRGRVNPIAPCPIRTDFMRDRDRIIHCKSFRRLKHKTQVFLDPQGDHYRTRLTHTLEVAQIARTIARSLRLNEDLTEAIALGHDLGHTPFGHTGEDVLNSLVPGGFHHNEQSLRVVEKLERDGLGLNLTYEVRDGILNHRHSGKPCTLEGYVVSFSDRIAYVNHDIDDALRAGLLTEKDLPTACVETIGSTHAGRINTLITDIVRESMDKPYVRFSTEIATAFDTLRSFMFERVYFNANAKAEETRARRLLELLYQHYVGQPGELPEDYRRYLKEDALERVVADYIAGMTDNFAIEDFRRIFIPKSWQ